MGRHGQLYIVPTLDGLKLLGLNMVLLIMGLVYANNYVLLFNFILFCLFIGSMFYTHFNLHGLNLLSAKFPPLHAGENGFISFSFKSRSSFGHHFLEIKIKSTFLEASEQTYHFSMKDHQSSTRVDFPVKAIKRGVSELKRIKVETRFPFHLFSAFTYFDLNIRTTIYPEKKAENIHNETALSYEKHDGEDDYTLKSFQPGDSLKRILWKKYAQTGKLITKQMASAEEQPVMLSFSKENLSSAEKERELSSLCFAIHLFHSQNMNYGLALEKITIHPGNSQQHLSDCLLALAEYET